MDVIKWVFSAVVALTVTLIATGLAAGAVILSVFFKLLGIFTFIAGVIAVLIKEKIDERNSESK